MPPNYQGPLKSPVCSPSLKYLCFRDLYTHLPDKGIHSPGLNLQLYVSKSEFYNFTHDLTPEPDTHLTPLIGCLHFTPTGAEHPAFSRRSSPSPPPPPPPPSGLLVPTVAPGHLASLLPSPLLLSISRANQPQMLEVLPATWHSRPPGPSPGSHDCLRSNASSRDSPLSHSPCCTQNQRFKTQIKCRHFSD